LGGGAGRRQEKWASQPASQPSSQPASQEAVPQFFK